MHNDRRDVIVVGGGISGLTAAWKLHKDGVDVCLLEANQNVGGYARTESRGGFLLEKGPFNIIVRHHTFQTLLEDVSNDIKVVAADRAARKRFIYRRGKLHPVPTNPIALATTGLLTMSERIRLVRGLIYSSCAPQQEETIDQAATRRFGRAVSNTIVSAAISGILAGDIRKLSVKACFPGVWRIDRNVKSLLGYGFASMFRSRLKKKASQPRRWRGLVSVDGGLGALTDAVGQQLGENLLTNTRVESIQPLDSGYEVQIKNGSEIGETISCRQLILATPIQQTSDFLKPICPQANVILNSIESASLVVMSLGFRRADVGHDLQGFGFLVPHDEHTFPLMGVLWADTIFPHHAPSDHRLIRIFMGGVRDPDAVTRSDDELIKQATNALLDVLRIKGDPVLSDISRYTDAIPQYHPGHNEKIEQLRTELRELEGLHLIGNYLQGVSINDCVRVATDLARDIIQEDMMNNREAQHHKNQSACALSGSVSEYEK